MKLKQLLLTLIFSLCLILSLMWLLGDHSPGAVLAQSGTGTIRVATTGTNTASCGSVGSPCRTVQYAIGQAAAGDEILVATGTYTDPIGTVVGLNKTVKLRGGWNSSFTIRDLTLYPTTLDARRAGSVISVTGQSNAPISPTIDGFIITRGDASSQEIKGGGLYSIYANPIVVNNVFTNNVANSIHYFTGDGGGLYLTQSPGVAVISNNVFISNTAAITGGWGQGGAIYSEYSSPLIVSNVITGNFANGFIAISDTRSVGGNGGGIALSYAATETVVISGNQLINNVSSVGEHGTSGGMMLSNGSFLVRGNTLRGNVACTNGWGVGGGIYLSGGGGPVTITDNLVESNTAGMGNGLGIGSLGGGLHLEYKFGPNPVLIQNNKFLSNTASTADWAIGGGLYIAHSDGPLTVTNNLIEGNRATTAPYSPGTPGAGGGIGTDNNPYSDPSTTLLIRDNIIRNNVAALNSWGEGGGYFARSDTIARLENNTIEGNVGAVDQTAYGGGLYIYLSPITLSRNTIRNNRASKADGYGGGVFVYRSQATLEANSFISNTSAISTTGTGVGWGGGVMLFVSEGITVTNNVIARNRAAGQGPHTGDGVWVGGSTIGEPTTTTLRHNTVADNAYEGIWFRFYATLALTNNLVSGHIVGITNTAPASATIQADHTLFYGNGIDRSSGITSTNEVHGDPAFSNPIGWDYHIGPTSAARDAGVNAGVSTDVDGDLRPLGSSYDIGADEFQPAANLLVTKHAHPDPVRPGAQLTYTIRVTNTGSTTLNGTITDTLPAHVTPGGSQSWPLTNLASGGIWTKTIVVTVDMGYTGTLTNVVRVGTLEGASGIYTTTTTVTVTEQHKLYLPLVLRQFSAVIQSTGAPTTRVTQPVMRPPSDPIAPPSLR